jgi:cytochrome P450
VFLLRASANRDEEVFERPDVLDLRRNPNPHLTFGHGEHHCFGAVVARAQIKILLEEVLFRLVDLRIAPGTRPRYDASPLFGVQSLPVVYSPIGVAS